VNVKRAWDKSKQDHTPIRKAEISSSDHLDPSSGWMLVPGRSFLVRTGRFCTARGKHERVEKARKIESVKDQHFNRVKHCETNAWVHVESRDGAAAAAAAQREVPQLREA
jgi:hypothetical protein